MYKRAVCHFSSGDSLVGVVESMALVGVAQAGRRAVLVVDPLA